MIRIASSSRRLGIVNVPESYVLEMFLSMGDKLPDYISLPQFDLPEGTKVLSVHHEPWNRSFQFTVEHESFAEVEPGTLIPWLNPAMGERVVRVVKPIIVPDVQWMEACEPRSTESFQLTDEPIIR